MVFSFAGEGAESPGLRRRAVLVASALMAALLVGCSSGGSSSDPDPAPTDAPTVVSTPGPVVRLGAIVWTTGLAETGEPTDDLDAIPRNAPVIYAAAPVEQAVAGERLSANWSLDGVPIDALASVVTLDQAAESGWVSFALTWEGETLWPVGSLEVSIVASSGSTVTGAVQIEST